MDKQKVIQIRADINEALKEVAAKHGLSINLGNARYGSNDCRFVRLECQEIVASNGATIDREKENFKYLALSYGMQKDWYGKRFYSNGHTYEIIGIKASRRKYPVSAKCCSTGRGYKFPVQAVKNGIIL